MEILFKTNKLARLCSQERVMTKALGPEGARKLKARLADLRAASNILEVRRGRPHLLRGGFEDCFGFDLDGGRRFVVGAAADPLPVLADGGVDWSKVSSVQVVFIGDYHD